MLSNWMVPENYIDASNIVQISAHDISDFICLKIIFKLSITTYEQDHSYST